MSKRDRAVLYLRQSVSREDSISLELQEQAGRDYCRQQGYEVIAVEADPGISGRTWKRPAVQRVMGMIETSKAEVIVLWKWSRLSRARLDWAVAIDKVEAAGGRIESATEQVDVRTSTGRFARGMLAEFAAFESDRIGDTWKEAHQNRINRGLPHSGTPRWGYTYDKEQGLHIPDPVTGPILADCYRRYLQGESFGQIAAYLKSTGHPTSHRRDAGAWTSQQAAQLLDAPFSAGYITYHGQATRGAHEPLITEETWEAYKVTRAQRAGTRGQSTPSHEYSGLLICSRPDCGHRLHLNSGRQSEPSYTCAGSHVYKIHTGGSIQKNIIDSTVLKWLSEEIAQQIDDEAKGIAPPAPRTGEQEANLKRAAMRADAKLQKLTEKYLEGVIPQGPYERIRDETTAQLQRIGERLNALSVAARQVRPKIDPKLLDLWGDMLPEERRRILSSLVAWIEVTSGRPRGRAEVVPKWDDRALTKLV